jgi:hypothetical protein
MNTMTTRTLGCALAAGLFALTGTALAQMEGFDRPLGEQRERQARQTETARTLVSMSQIEGDQRYDLEVRDGAMTARVNGREVPQDRIRREGDVVSILDRSGNVLTTFRVQMPRIEREGRPLGRRAPMLVPPDAPLAPLDAPDAAPPRVMIGIVMSEVPEVLLDHLELEACDAVMIDKVIEGLPAEDAGLRARDIIVAIDGERPVDPVVIRDRINAKDPGQQVEVTVVRRGQETTIPVTLKAFDEEQMRAARPELPAPPGRLDIRPPAEAERLLRENLEQFQNRFNDDHMERLRERFQARGGEGFDFFIPFTPGDQRGTRDRLTQLDERLGDLERQMERLADRLDDLLRRSLERREERRRE